MVEVLLDRPIGAAEARRDGVKLPDANVHFYSFYFPTNDDFAAIAEAFHSGNIPEVGNGFSFDYDRRPRGQEDKHIPHTRYTQYYSEGFIPVAWPRHKLHEHDLKHAAVSQRLFRNPTFANVVRGAASNARHSSPSHSRAFTQAMDGIGDAMAELSLGKRQADHLQDYNAAQKWLSRGRFHLENMVTLYTGGLPQVSGELSGSSRMLVDTLWQGIDLARYSSFIKTRRARKK